MWCLTLFLYLTVAPSVLPPSLSRFLSLSLSSSLPSCAPVGFLRTAGIFIFRLVSDLLSFKSKIDRHAAPIEAIHKTRLLYFFRFFSIFFLLQCSCSRGQALHDHLRKASESRDSLILLTPQRHVLIRAKSIRILLKHKVVVCYCCDITLLGIPRCVDTVGRVVAD